MTCLRGRTSGPRWKTSPTRGAREDDPREPPSLRIPPSRPLSSSQSYAHPAPRYASDRLNPISPALAQAVCVSCACGALVDGLLLLPAPRSASSDQRGVPSDGAWLRGGWTGSARAGSLGSPRWACYQHAPAHFTSSVAFGPSLLSAVASEQVGARPARGYDACPAPTCLPSSSERRRPSRGPLASCQGGHGAA